MAPLPFVALLLDFSNWLLGADVLPITTGCAQNDGLHIAM
jgi:hypothetical protein